MPKTKEQKQELVDKLAEKIKASKITVISDLQGLTVEQTQELRNQLKQENVEVLATKKTLLKIALEKIGLTDAHTKQMQGGLSVAISNEDEVIPAKIIKDFAKKHESVQFRGGILEGVLINESQLAHLASLPSKIELYAKLVGSLKAPISGFTNVLAGNLRGLINVLNAIKENK